jgi:hypothetical protein
VAQLEVFVKALLSRKWNNKLSAHFAKEKEKSDTMGA